MHKEVYKGRLGWAEADEKHPATHVLVPEGEFREMQRKAKETSQLKFEFERKIEQINKSYQEEIEKIMRIGSSFRNDESEKDLHIKELSEKIKNAEAEAEFQSSLNLNLLRICKERANSDRKLKPKKEHTGYVVISSQEKEIRYHVGKKMMTAVVWETVFQSPYSIEFTEAQARKLIVRELLTNDGGWKLVAVGIIQRCMVDYGILKEKYPEEIKKENMAFNERLKVNYKVGYWEYIVLHTLPLGVVPKEMLP